MRAEQIRAIGRKETIRRRITLICVESEDLRQRVFLVSKRKLGLEFGIDKWPLELHGGQKLPDRSPAGTIMENRLCKR